MSNAMPNQAAIRARVARAEDTWATTPSPALKALERKQRRERQLRPEPIPQGQAQTAIPVMDVPPAQSAYSASAGDEPWGKLQVVRCTLESYESVAVTFRTNNTLGTIRNIPESSDKAAFATWVGRFVKGIEWGYSKPPPDPTTAEGLETWENEYQDLLLWIISDGYAAARSQAAGPEFRPTP